MPAVSKATALGRVFVKLVLFGSKTMVYDWDGARTRRLRLFRTGTAFLIALAVFGVPLFVYTAKFHGFYG
jgi:hypothetical protein